MSIVYINIIVEIIVAIIAIGMLYKLFRSGRLYRKKAQQQNQKSKDKLYLRLLILAIVLAVLGGLVYISFNIIKISYLIFIYTAPTNWPIFISLVVNVGSLIIGLVLFVICMIVLAIYVAIVVYAIRYTLLFPPLTIIDDNDNETETNSIHYGDWRDI